jgi:hypothetical protein
MLGIIDHLLKKKESEKILLSTVESTFKQQYGQSITSVLKALTIKQNFPVFLQACSNLNVQFVDKQWIITLKT